MNSFARASNGFSVASLPPPPPAKINWLLWNRNPDLFERRWGKYRMRTNFLTNSLRDPVLDVIDLVVFAGTPDWTGRSVERVYRSLLAYPQIPVLVVGVGSGAIMPRLAPYEIEVLDRSNVFISTRSFGLAECLNSQLSTPKAIPLPCPAFYSVGEPTAWPGRHRIGVIVQSSETGLHGIGEGLFQSLITALRNAQGKIDLDIVSFYIDEHLRFSRLGLDHPCVYSYESDDLFTRLADYSLLISTRLHGAITGLSAGIPSILLAEDDNVRIRSTQELFGEFLPMMAVPDAFSVAAASTPEALRRRSGEILEFKANAFANLVRVLGEFLRTNVPGVWPQPGVS